MSAKYALLTRHEETRMSLDIDPRTRERYHLVGVEWKPNKHLRLAAVAKQLKQETAKKSLESHEAGLWAQIAF